MLPAYSICWQHNSIKKVGSKNFWADLKKEVSTEETDRTCTTNTLQTNCWPKKYLLINVIHVGYAIQIFYSGQKEPWRVYSYCKNSFDAYDYWRGRLSFCNPSCSPQFSASTSRVYNVQRTAKCPDIGLSKKICECIRNTWVFYRIISKTNFGKKKKKKMQGVKYLLFP